MSKVVPAIKCLKCGRIVEPKVYDNGYCQKCGTKIFGNIDNKHMTCQITVNAKQIVARKYNFFGERYKEISDEMY